MTTEKDDEDKGWFGHLIEVLVAILFFWAE